MGTLAQPEAQHVAHRRKTAGNLPKADPAILLNSPHCKPSQVSSMDEEQISSLLLLESSSDAHAP